MTADLGGRPAPDSFRHDPILMTSSKLLSIDDFRRAARRRLPRVIYEYVFHGAEDDRTLANNRHAFETLLLRPRGLVGVEERHQAVSLWGKTYPAPFGIAPMGATAVCRRQCDLLIARAAQSRGLPYIISGAACVALETIQAAIGTAWYQGYLPGDTVRLQRMVDRLRKANIDVLVVTCDTAVGANRENNERNGFKIPFRPSWRLFLDGLLHPRWSIEVFLSTLIQEGVPHFPNLMDAPGPAITAIPPGELRSGRALLTWEHIDWLREHWPGKLVIKGVLHPDDAQLAVHHGADGIIISNHGGRQLDGAIATLSALAAIRQAVPGDFVVMLDSGVRRGTDVLKARALGADMVFIGRPALYGASVAGEQGAGRVLDILRTEVDRDLALLGCPRIGDLNEDYLDPVSLAQLRGA